VFTQVAGGTTTTTRTWVLLLLETFWDPKNVHVYTMYLKHGSLFGLMMAL
jgi:hypothetical protein